MPIAPSCRVGVRCFPFEVQFESMTIKINQNLISLLVQRNLGRVSSRMNESISRLSSGERIQRASDDPSGMATSQEIRYEIRGLQRNQQNISGAFNVIGVAESGMETIQTALQRARELAVQAGNDTLSPSDRNTIQQEIDAILAEIQRAASETSYLGRRLLDGTFLNQIIQVGTAEGQSFNLSISDLRTAALGQVAQSSGAAVSTAPIAGGGDLTINAINIPASAIDGISTTLANASAIAKAAAINSVENQTGVRATVGPAVYQAPGAAISPVNIDGTTRTLSINGVAIGPVNVSAGDSDGRLVDAINQKSSITGVTASVDPSGALRLEAADGRNIAVTTTGSVADELGLAAADGDLSNAVASGTITLTSSSAFSVGGTFGLIGFTPAQSTINLDPATAIAGLSMVSSESANAAIASIDNAIRQISNARAGIGSIQNRLEAVEQSLAKRIEDLTGADSRIRDADFALETARLTQAQILQEAGTALLAQANVTPRTALQLLLR